MSIIRWWAWLREHRGVVTWIAVGLTSGGVGWVALLWWRAGGSLTDRWLDVGDRIASIASAILAAAGVMLAYLVWRQPHLTSGPMAAPVAPSRHEASLPLRQLPLQASRFTGRAKELEQLLELVRNLRQTTTVVISAIDGMAGIGKTALAVYAAHRMVDQFPDGQLFIDLHGYTKGLAPIEPAEALDRLLRDLGIPGTQIPATLDERAALYRTRLAAQRVLIVLDNAATENQIAPLLPGTPGPLVLVTSRRRLALLDHSHTLSLDTLPISDAIALFTQAAGKCQLIEQPPSLVVELVELCGRLPLAIRIAAARLRSHPTWHLSDLVERLRDQRRRLGELAAGDRSVTAALDLSYQYLDLDEQEAYRMLGMHPGPEIDAYATAALLESTLLHAGRVLDQLFEAHLLQETTPGRYRFHDLTRAHAATREQPAPNAEAALGRLMDYYRRSAAVAMYAAYPYEWEDHPQVPPRRTPSPELPDPAAGLAWLETELPNLLAAARSATAHSRPGHLLHYSRLLHSHLRTGGRYYEAETLQQQALATARILGDHAGELTALNGLGDILGLQGWCGQAADHLEQALQIARTTGNRPGELDALNGLGYIHWRQGRYGEAADHFEHALQVARIAGNRPGELKALMGLGQVHRMQNRYEQAADQFEQALQIARTTGNRPGELDALNGVGDIHRMQGRTGQAANHLEQALQIARIAGNRLGEVNALNGLGYINRRQGRYELAADRFERALQIARAIVHRRGELNALVGLGCIDRRQGRHERAANYCQRLLDLAQASGDRNYEFEARQCLGWLQHAAGNPDAAIAHLEQALTLAYQLGQPEDQARAHDGLARVHHALHQREQARTHWQHALDLLTSLGNHHTLDEETTITAVRAHLANAGVNGSVNRGRASIGQDGGVEVSRLRWWR